MRKENRKLPNTVMCEELISTLNFKEAIKKVKSNKGSPGIDGMSVDELDINDLAMFEETRSRILARVYRAKPVRTVEIPKDDGTKRKLGIPTVMDRVVQQAVVQVITEPFEKTFSDFSYGYRPNRSAEDATRQIQIYIAEGYKHVIEMDLSKYFDTVNHDILMNEVDKTLFDKDIRRLIYVFLKSGSFENGFKIESDKGTPQGGVISPLLANIYLTPFDKEMENRGVKFVRFADDICILSKSKMAAGRIKRNAIKFLEKKLKLKINEEKTVVRRAYKSKLLGFEILSSGKIEDGKIKLGMCRAEKRRIEKLKDKIRSISKRNRGISLERLICELNLILRGWINYFARANMVRTIEDLGHWIRRKIRQYAYKLWKTSKSRKHHLRELGVKEWQLNNLRCSSNSYWKMAFIWNRFITNKMLTEKLNLLDIENYYKEVHAKHIKRDISKIYQYGLNKERMLKGLNPM